MESQIAHNTAPTAPLYNELPFPDDGIIRTTAARILARGLVRHRPDWHRDARIRIIDVGCGTGEVSAGLAQWFPQAELVSIDINPPSLEKARNLARRHRLNIRFVHADITDDLAATLERAGVLGSGGFDVVVSVGVLHHLHDPAEGFRQVRRIVAANGLLLCYMYSRHGRREDMAVKEFLNEALPASSSYATRADFLRLLNLANRDTPWAFLKSLRYRLRFGPPVVLREMLKSFFTRNLVARQSDTFSNPCEHLYSFGELKNLCAQTGWDILGLAEKGGLPTSPEAHSRRVEMLRRLQQLPPEILYDYFAFYYRAGGFTFFARPV